MRVSLLCEWYYFTVADIIVIVILKCYFYVWELVTE
jgi:hypothetical protein